MALQQSSGGKNCNPSPVYGTESWEEEEEKEKEEEEEEGRLRVNEK